MSVDVSCVCDVGYSSGQECFSLCTVRFFSFWILDFNTSIIWKSIFGVLGSDIKWIDPAEVLGSVLSKQNMWKLSMFVSHECRCLRGTEWHSLENHMQMCCTVMKLFTVYIERCFVCSLNTFISPDKSAFLGGIFESVLLRAYGNKEFWDTFSVNTPKKASAEERLARFLTSVMCLSASLVEVNFLSYFLTLFPFSFLFCETLSDPVFCLPSSLFSYK